MNNYEFLIFDADGTLFDFSRAEAFALKQTFQDFSIENFREDTHLRHYREINGVIWREFEEGLITPKTLKTERFERLFTILNLDLNPASFSSCYLEHLSQCSFLLPGALPLITALKDSHTICLLTNGLSSVQHPRFDNSELSSLIDYLIVSEDVGIAKPDPGIFQILFEKAGRDDPSASLMIGDSLTSDIQGGINFGIDTCWFNPGNSEKNPLIQPTYEIQNLHELNTLILQ